MFRRHAAGRAGTAAPFGAFFGTRHTRAPPAGRYDQPVTVTLSCPTEGASIGYTLEDGDKARWKLYHEPIRLERTNTLRAKAVRLGYKESVEAQGRYEIGESAGER